MNPELLEKFDNLVKDQKGKRVGIVYDSDADGMSSGVITAKAMERLGAEVVYTQVHTESGGALALDVVQKLPELKLDLLITCDKPIDQDVNRVLEAEKHTKILVIDHHQINADIQSEKTLFIKAQFLRTDKEGGSQYPTAKLAYDLFSRVTDIQDLDWIAAAGLIADASYKSWKPFVNDILTTWNEPIPEDIFTSKVAKPAKLMNNVLIFSKDLADEIFSTLMKAKTADDFINSDLTQYEQVVQDETDYWLKAYKEKGEFHDDLNLLWYDIKPKFKVASPISTILSMNTFPKKTVIIATEKEDSYSFSLRRQDKKVDMAKMAGELTKDLENANGGGHIPAAGASVKKEDYALFKERVLKYLAEHEPR